MNEPAENLEDLEVWKQVPSNLDYAVSNHGRARSRKSGRWVALKPVVTQFGYLQIGMYSDGGHRSAFLHVLVAEAFVAGRAPWLEVNHKDGDKSNARASNLEWATRSQNQIHSREVLRNDHNRAQKRPVTVTHLRSGVVLSFPSLNSAARSLSISAGNLHSTLQGTRSNAGGYTAVYGDQT